MAKASKTSDKQPAARAVPMPVSKYQAFFERPGVKLGMGSLALLLAYVFFSWAIDSGSLLDYAITALLLFSGIRDLWDFTRGRLDKRKA
jgi:uncharacterized membrane protein HdeD (DUF308 family)